MKLQNASEYGPPRCFLNVGSKCAKQDSLSNMNQCIQNVQLRNPETVHTQCTVEDSPVTKTVTLSERLSLWRHCCTALSTAEMTLSFNPPASHDLRKPTCTRGRVPISLWPLVGGWATLQACIHRHPANVVAVFWTPLSPSLALLPHKT